MSWDIWVINSVEEIPFDDIDEDKLDDFGELDILIEKISKLVPEIDWNDKTYSHLDNGDYLGHIWINVNEYNRCDSLMFIVYGGDNPLKTITQVCQENNWLAIDTVTGKYLDLLSPDDSGWKQFQDFRKTIHAKVGGESPATISMSNKKWWQFWK